MMNLQEFYIQHLGIGAIWKLRQLDVPDEVEVGLQKHNALQVNNQIDKQTEIPSNSIKENEENVSAFSVGAASSHVAQESNQVLAKLDHVEFDILVIGSSKTVLYSENRSTNVNVNANENELLFKNILLSFQSSQNDKPLEVAVNKIDLSSEPILFEQFIHLMQSMELMGSKESSRLRVLSFFESEILQRFLDYYSLQQQMNPSSNGQLFIQKTSLQQVFLFNNLLLIQFPSMAEMIEKPSLKKEIWEKICFLQKHLQKSS